MKLISVIIPTYNSEKFISRTIKSVLKQTHKDWELIIVDDLSKDNTREILKVWQSKDDRIHLLLLDENSGGPAHPKNVGIENASGEYIAFLDHDDEWLPEKLERQINFFEDKNHKNYGLVTCDSAIIVAGQKSEYVTPIYDESDQLINLLKGDFVHSCSSILIRRNVLDLIAGFDEKLKWSDDWDLYIRILASGHSIGVVSEKLFIWHSQEMSAGKTLMPLEKAKELEFIISKHKGLFLSSKEVYSKNLRTLGILYCLAGEFDIGRSHIYNSYKLGYRSYATICLYLLSFMQSKLLLNKLLAIRKKTSGESLDQT